jgi:hypothetical protein
LKYSFIFSSHEIHSLRLQNDAVKVCIILSFPVKGKMTKSCIISVSRKQLIIYQEITAGEKQFVSGLIPDISSFDIFTGLFQFQ